MVADLRKMQENQGVSENRIDKYGFVYKENRPDTGGEDSRIYYKQL